MDQDVTWHAGRPQPWPDSVRWGTQLPTPKRRTAPNFRPISIAAKRLDALRYHLVQRYASAEATLCYMGTQLPLPKSSTAPLFGPCPLWPNGWGGWTEMPLGMELGLGSGNFELDGDQAAIPQNTKTRGTAPHSIFAPYLLWRNGWVDQDSTRYGDRPRSRQRYVRQGRSSV